jgi:hypothetical protein
MTTPIAERVAGQSAARAATPFRHRPRDPPSIPASTPSRRRPSLPADPWEPVLTYFSPSPSRPALVLAGPACRARESGHPGNALAGLTAGSGRGRETGFAPI